MIDHAFQNSILVVPCTSSNAGSLSSLANGDALIAVHVMFAALSVEVLKVDLRIPSVPSTNTVVKVVPISSSISIPLARQNKLVPTAVQVNSATSLIETLTARGGIVISTCVVI